MGLKNIYEIIKYSYNFLPKNFPKHVVLRQLIQDHLVALASRKDYESINFNEKDWDNLIILDACRYDTFRQNNPFEKEPEKVNSNSSHTIEFVKKNFSDEHLDTVYVTASPMVSRFGGEFAHIEHLWQDEWSDKKTVLPEDVADKGIEMSEKFREKRLVIHFMQPHFPFIGDKAEEIGRSTFDQREKRSDGHVWEKALSGRVELEKVKEAYEENLCLALGEVKRLVDNLEGKTVITADHGNLFGKKPTFLPFKIYGHPAYLKDRDLTAVPWLEIDRGGKKISSGKSESSENLDEREIKTKLKMLGYG